MAVEGDVLLEMRGIEKSFPGVKALRGVDLQVPAGHVLGLVGENGAGKSTLMKVLSGAYDADKGVILVEGKELPAGTSAAISAGIAVIYQELSLVNDMSVMENLFLGRVPSKAGFLRRGLARDRAREALSEVGLAAVDPDTRVGDLPLNKRQLVELAKALVRDARILVMDEPTAALQSQDVENLYKVVKALKKRNLAIVLISHHLEEVFELADSAVVMRDGSAVASRPIADWDEAAMVRAMVDRDLDDFFPWKEREIGEIVLEVSGLVSAPLVRDASLVVRAGEIVGVGGIAGAGRTDFLKAISAAESYSAGQVRVGGSARKLKSPTDALANGVIYVPEDRKLEGLVMEASISENIALSNLRRISRWGFVNAAKKKALANAAVKRFGVRTTSIGQMAGTLSGGNQQKVILGRATASHPRIILLDEPTRGIDVGAKAEIYGHMITMAREGAAIVMVSSELPELLGMSDRVVVMFRGRTVADLPRDQATSEIVTHWATTGMGLES
ncbi:sugar ABC transporter ATP-binding protein [Glaciihabitans sp. UYNi722]|uniref:sugar ABC transporter ATP-binding protein n=1 Tax=Glaciihabitans sp. UYNi722 TaxID=3156344 RepID=UPI003390B9BB